MLENNTQHTEAFLTAVELSQGTNAESSACILPKNFVCTAVLLLPVVNIVGTPNFNIVLF